MRYCLVGFGKVIFTFKIIRYDLVRFGPVMSGALWFGKVIIKFK